MSGYAKGTRKPKGGVALKEINVGGMKIKPAVAIVSLIAALYLVFLADVGLESGLDALILAAFSFAMFVVLAYLARSGSLSGLKPFTLLIDAFIVLSALSLAQALAGFLNIVGPSTDSTAQRLAFTMTVSAVAAAILLTAVLYFEKEKRENIYLKASPLRPSLAGLAIFAACGLVAIIAAYFLFGVQTFMMAALNILLFGLLGGAYEEALFRGLLLSRLRRVLDENYALAIQALVFAVFEALTAYTFTSNIILIPLILIIAAIAGYFFGIITLKNESILAPQLMHAGLYMLLALPLITV